MTSENFDLLVVLEEESEDCQVIRVHSLGTMNMFTRFHVNPTIKCCDILFKARNVNLLAALEEKSGYHQNQYASSTGERVFEQNSQVTENAEINIASIYESKT